MGKALSFCSSETRAESSNKKIDKNEKKTEWYGGRRDQQREFESNKFFATRIAPTVH